MSFDVHRLVALGRVGSHDVSPDGSWLAVAVGRADDEGASYRSELWRVNADGTQAKLFEGAFSDGSPRFRADGALLFLSDRARADHVAADKADKDTTRQVWALLPGGRVERLTDEPLGVSDFQVADSGRLVVLTRVLPGLAHHQQRAAAEDRKKRGPSLLHYTDMPVRFWDHWLGDARATFVRLDPDGTRVILTPGADREYEVEPSWDLSADGRTLVTTRERRGPLRVPLHALDVIDVQTGARRVVGESPDKSVYGVVLDPGARRVAVSRGVIDARGLGRHHVHVIDLATGLGRDLATDWDRWPGPVAWLDDDTILATADDDGSLPIFAVNATSGKVTRLTPDACSHHDVRVVGGRITAVRDATLEPPEVVRIEAGATTRLTRLAGIGPEELGELAVVERTEVTSTDGAQVPLYVVRPREAGLPRPSLLWIHGGPRSQWGQSWHWRWSPLIAVAQGYVVGLPNPRGSTGLGQAWVDAIWGNTWGGQCYEDVLAAADALQARPDVDPRRSCAMGGSFGGYMTNWIGSQTDRFTCLVTHASIASFHMFGWTTDHPAWWQLDLGSMWEDRARYELYSPDRHVKNWRTPTLVVHGEKDYRVPISEGLALFELLRQHGVEAELAIFPDENHWILKPRNVVAWYDTVFGFLDRHLR